MTLQKSTKSIIKYIPSFIDYCEVEKGLSNNTQRNYAQYLSLFQKLLAETDSLNLLPHQLTAEHIWDYRIYIARTYKTRLGHYLEKKSQNYYLIGFYTYGRYKFGNPICV